MEQIEIGLIGGPPLPIKKGLPEKYDSRKLYNADCYYIEVEPGENIVFQNINLGPFSCWYTEYLFKRAKTFYCRMKSGGVEFHCMIEGGAMYDLGTISEEKWYIEKAGSLNILVNGPEYTKTAFNDISVKTFDIHISVEYFRALTDLYPAFKKLMPALQSNFMDTLYCDDEVSTLDLRVEISQVLLLLEKNSVNLNELKRKLMQHFEAIIALYATANTTQHIQHNFVQSEIEAAVQIRNYIAVNYIDSKVIANARLKYAIPEARLRKLFMLWYNLSPKDFFIFERFKKAKLFIQQNPKADKTKIARSVGYTDGKYLNKLFLRFEGCSIDAYRQHLKL